MKQEFAEVESACRQERSMNMIADEGLLQDSLSGASAKDRGVKIA